MVKTQIFIILFILPVCLFSGVNPYITGVFFQTWGSHNSFSTSDWITRYNDMKKIGLDTVIIQFIAINGTSFYNDNLTFLTNSYPNILPRNLSAANTTGINLFVPTYYDTNWFSKGTTDSFLSENATKNSNLISDLVDNIKINTNRCFAGWFIPYEIDDVMFISPENRAKLVNFLNSIANYCKIKTPGKPVSIAPFFSKNLPVTDFKNFWNYILSNTPNLDIVILQDGVGARNWDVTTILDYYNAMKEACDSNNKTFWSDLEIFTNSGKPASIDRIKDQLLYEAPYCQKIVSFEYLFYLDKWRNSDTLKLYVDYSNYYASSISLDNNPPKILRAGFVKGLNNKIEIEFDEPINSVIAKERTNYKIVPPDIYPDNIELISGNLSKIYLCIPPLDTTLFYTLYIKNIEDLYQNKITPDTAVIIGGEEIGELPTEVYPNPVRINFNTTVVFRPVKTGSKVKIYNFNGKLIKVILNNFNNEVFWDMKDNDGKTVSEGVYFYIIESQTNKQRGLFVIFE